MDVQYKNHLYELDILSYALFEEIDAPTLRGILLV